MEKSRFRGHIWRWLGIAFAALVVAGTPRPAAADVASASASGFFGEAGGAFFAFVVNPDGSLSCYDFGFGCFGPSTSGGLAWEFDADGSPLGSAGGSSLLDFPALPPGSIIDSATVSFDANVGTNYAVPFNNVGYTVEGSLALQSVTFSSSCGGGGSFSAPFSGVEPIAFVPCPFGDTFFTGDFSGGGDATADAVIPSEPGAYVSTLNVGVSVDYTITVNYSETPEPHTYGLLIGLGMVGFFAIRIRRASWRRIESR